MAIDIGDNIKTGAPKPTDSRYLNNQLPWTGVTEVNIGISGGVGGTRYIGLTVNINGEEYWYKDGIEDVDLIQKSLGGTSNLTGTTNGISLANGGTTVALGGTLTGNTTFDGTGSQYTLQYADDYSIAFTPRTLVDQGYVTGLTSQAFTTAENGVCSNGQTISLGGSLTAPTAINTAGNNFCVCSNGQDRQIYIDGSEVRLRFSGGTGTGTVSVQSGGISIISQNNTEIASMYLDNPTGRICFNADGGYKTYHSPSGFYYTSSYAGTGGSDPRWIPDNAYVTGLTTGAIKTASNGLTKVNTDVKLGGTLSENTSVCLGGGTPYSLCVKNSGATTCTVAEFKPTTINLCTSNVDSPFQLGKLSTSFGATTVYNGYANCYSSLSMSNSLMGVIICGGASNASFIVTDATTTKRGIEYANCYHGTYSDRSLVDKQYVTSQVSGITESAITGATNGLCKVGQDVILGGTLTGDTTISGGTFGLTYDYYNPLSRCTTANLGGNITFQSCKSSNSNCYGYFQVTDNIIIMCSTDNPGLCNTYFYTAPHSIRIGGCGTAQLEIFDETVTQEGLKYHTCVSTGFTNSLSLVDKGYVDTCVDSQVSGTITGATNGLTKVGQNVVLGGTLTGATTVNLTGNTFKLQSGIVNCGVADFSLNNTYVNSKFGICSNGGGGIIWGLSGDSTSISAQHCNSSSNGSSMSINDTGLTLTNKNSSVSKVVKLTNNALTYADCYHTSYNNRTLIDKEYLDIQMCYTSNVMTVVNPPLSATYHVQRYDDLVPVSGISSNEICLNYCAALGYPVLGQRVTIVDVCGGAFIDPIIINGNGYNINGDSACSLINTDYGSVTYVFNGYFWSAMAFIN